MPRRDFPPDSRERNRVHARNTRERKKQLMDDLQGRIEALFEEKISLTTTTATTTTVDTCVASILMSLGEMGAAAALDAKVPPTVDAASSSREYIAVTLEKLRLQISSETRDDEDDVDGDVEGSLELLKKSKTGSNTPLELEMIRRERNRLHARNTRQRKKKMMFEMEAVRFSLFFFSSNLLYLIFSGYACLLIQHSLYRY